MSKQIEELTKAIKVLESHGVKIRYICPSHGDLGFRKEEETCTIKDCNKKLIPYATFNICGVMSDWHRKDYGKHKKNPHIKWSVTSGMLPTDLLDATIPLILFGRSSVMLKVEFLLTDN